MLRTSGSGVALAPPRARRPLEIARSRSVPARRARGGAGRCRGARRTRRSFGAAAVTVLVATLGASAARRRRPRSTTVATARAVGLSTAPSIVRGSAGAGVATGDAGVSAWGSSPELPARDGSLTGGSTTMAGAAAVAGAEGSAGASTFTGSGALGTVTGTGVAGRAGRKSSGSR